MTNCDDSKCPSRKLCVHGRGNGTAVADFHRIESADRCEAYQFPMFRSVLSPGLLMNEYGVVMDGHTKVGDSASGAVKREAVKAGWRKLDNHPRANDLGSIWIPPKKS